MEVYIGVTTMKEMDFYMLEVFVPPEAVAIILAAIAKAGGGRIDRYDYTASTMQVTGYWRPLKGAKPYRGKEGEISSEPEIKIEVTCKHEHIHEVLQAIYENHPYEQPLINILPLVNELFIDPDESRKYGP
jgi:hypothetical protein